VGGIRDFVEHQVNAWVVVPDDASGLAEGIRSLLGDGDRAAHLGHAARATVLDRFGEEAVAIAYERLLTSVLQSSPAGASS